MKKISFFIILILLLLPKDGLAAEFIRVGTASITGVYYYAGNALCRLVKRLEALDHSALSIACSIQSTPGAMYNLNSLHSQGAEIGVAQADWAYKAYYGEEPFKELRPNLRSIFSIHKEAFTIVARKTANIKTINDLKGKRINIGAPGTGVRGTMQALMQIKQWTKKDFALTTELPASEQAEALCDGKVDVIVDVIGHPNGSIKEATALCATELIPLDEATITAMINAYPYYQPIQIEGGVYISNPEPINTFGVRASFFTNEGLSDEIVYNITKAIFTNKDLLLTLHPVFANLQLEEMVPLATPIPIHNGALKYYKEAGLVKDNESFRD